MFEFEIVFFIIRDINYIIKQKIIIYKCNVNVNVKVINI